MIVKSSFSLAQLVAVGSFAMLAAAGAKAESYEGVHAPVSAMSRADVNAEAVRAAAAPDQNVTSGSRVNSKVISTMQNPVDARASAANAKSSRL